MWRMQTTLGRELGTWDAMNTLGHDAMSNSGLQWIAHGYVNNPGLWAVGSIIDQLERECDTQTSGLTTHVQPNDEGSAQS